MMSYVKQVYEEFEIMNPTAEINISELTSSASAQKTVKKRKIHLMSS